jgi:uncharacterized peroxidase-related enzyme
LIPIAAGLSIELRKVKLALIVQSIGANMTRISIPTYEQVPEAAKGTLDKVQKNLAFAPNLQRMMSQSPAVLNGWAALQNALSTTLDLKTRDAIALAVSEVNQCSYCLAAHTWVSMQFAKIPPDEIARNRHGESIDAKRAAAASFAGKLVQLRGKVAPEDVLALRAAGYSEANVLEIIALASQFLMTNLINNAMDTTVDFPPKVAA